MAERPSLAQGAARVHLRGGGVSGDITYLRQGAGPVVVLIHGVGMNAAIWQPQMAALAAAHDVIALDMPGHGGSLLPPDPPTLDDYADAVIGLLDALGIPAAALVGHSMGALVATHTALRNPERVSRLIAMNAVFRRSPELKQAVQARAVELEEKGFSASIAPTLARWFGDPVPANLELAAALSSAALRTVNVEGYRRTYWLFATSDEALAPALPGLKVPALFITGEFDANSSPAMSREMARIAPCARAEIVPGVRHMMALTHPDEINSRLIAFLDETPADASRPLPAEVGP
ncbi:alpha/beta fold hydrolase [Aquabacter sp. P-9]|uniref:alpha/beta fold hydrolase n=1 Tax=Aquabacter sediminis TaxID=3029197 RepID=UPI00237EAEC3|nr:alpha/beta hydrolase [Aquabacter sp. P-9]MDE1566726.1 alpha/beta hydrolase [Aquabacter sp. P-9]